MALTGMERVSRVCALEMSDRMVAGRDFKWISEHHPELQRKYERQYVAVKNRKVIAHGPDFGKVFYKAKQEARKDFVTEYILPLAPFILNNPTEEAWMRLQSEIRKTRKRVTAGEVLKELERVETPS